jgi:hypothetical protein
VRAEGTGASGQSFLKAIWKMTAVVVVYAIAVLAAVLGISIAIR